MTFPYRPTLFSRTSLAVTAVDLFCASLILYITVIGLVGLTQGLWHLCVMVFHRWWFIFQLPVYWLVIVVWLLLVIVACVMVALVCTVYYRTWRAIRGTLVSDDTAQ